LELSLISRLANGTSFGADRVGNPRGAKILQNPDAEFDSGSKGAGGTQGPFGADETSEALRLLPDVIVACYRKGKPSKLI
jgi:hypothetical protein